MTQQISKQTFTEALKEMGINPKQFEGKRLTLDALCKLYELDEKTVIEAIDRDEIMAHYDYHKDLIWVDAIDAAHFYYCLKSKRALYTLTGSF